MMEARQGGSDASDTARHCFDGRGRSPPTHQAYSTVPQEDGSSPYDKGSFGQRAVAAPVAEVAHHSPGRQKQHGGRIREGVTIWWKELLASVVATGAIIVTFATLYHYQGKPLPEWPDRISINAVLSVYMLLLRAGVAVVVAAVLARQKWSWFGSDRPLYDIALFDEATRGAWGSLRLIQRVHFRYLITSLGCLIGVMVILVDPLAQQILRYTECSVCASGNGFAGIPRTNFFEGHGLDMRYSQSLSSAFQDAITVGITAPGSPVDVQCSTGNCTFPIFDTLGFCSSCEDLSDRVRLKYGNTSQQSSHPRGTVTSHLPGYEGGVRVTFAGDLSSSSCTFCEPMSSNFSSINGDYGPIHRHAGITRRRWPTRSHGSEYR